jgi:ribA/ribD-fused uncharacterized protein
MISGFNGANFFLSNFYVLPFEYKGLIVQTAENAFQANKTIDSVERMAIALAPTPQEAKRLGRMCTMRSNWDVYRDEVMLDVVRTKFFSDYGLAKKLISTGEQRLVETNHWGDKYWGVYQGEGLNKLGQILEVVRAEVRRKEWFN